MFKRRGDFLLSVVLATVLLLFILKDLLYHRNLMNETLEQNYAIEELSLVGQAAEQYIKSNRAKILDMFSSQSGTNDENTTIITSSNTSEIASGMDAFLPGNKKLSTMKNIWNDPYTLVLIRSKSTVEERKGNDTLTAYVHVGGNSYITKHQAGTDSGDKWLGGDLRRAAMKGGGSFGFISTESDGQKIRSGGWETNLGLDVISAHDGDLAYLVNFNMTDMTSQALMRYPTGDNEDQTLHTDIDMNDNNILNIQYLESQAIDTRSIRFDPKLYSSREEAEDSCKNNWIYVYDMNGNKRRVDTSGNVYTGETASGKLASTLGMNRGEMSERVQFDASVSAEISNIGRVYYISPENTEGSTAASVKSSQLAVCRVINGTQTLAYLGDNRAEDKISFVVSALDGDFIPPFYCPGQDANVAGSDELASGRNLAKTTNEEGIMPRLFVMPQVVSTGRKALPIHGIRAWAETVAGNGNISKGWIIRLNALVDVQSGAVGKRSYWIGSYPSDKQKELPTEAGLDTPGYKSTHELHQYLPNATTASASVNFLRAVVIGVCSGKIATF